MTPRCHILVVEDDDDIRLELVELLCAEGYDATGAADGREALALIGARQPTLILLDLMMPVMDGWELAARLAADEATAGIPLIVLSGASNSAGHARELGAAAHLSKPFDVDELIQMLTSLQA